MAETASGGEPGNRPAAHVVAAADLSKRLVAALAALKRLALLMRCELGATTELDAARRETRGSRKSARQLSLQAVSLLATRVQAPHFCR